MVAQPASSSFLLFGLSLIGKTPCLNLASDRVDGGTSSDYSLEDLKNRWPYYEKHASHPIYAIKPLSVQRSFYSYSAQTFADLIIFVLPRHGKNNGGKGEFCLKSENKSKNTKNTYKLTHSIIKINPMHA